MIETRVRVTAAADGMAWVAASEESGCGGCRAKSTCGISGLGKFLSQRRPDLSIGPCDAQAGDELLIRVDEAELLRAGLFAYLLPTVLAVFAAAMVDAYGAGNLVSALAAVLGLFLGLVIARLLAPQPHIHAHSIPPSTTWSNP